MRMLAGTRVVYGALAAEDTLSVRDRQYGELLGIAVVRRHSASSIAARRAHEWFQSILPDP